MIISAHKEIGETMTEVLERTLREFDISEPATYAGRLDPAASGVVVLLTGDDRFYKDHYLKAQKTYTVNMLVGLQTDTDDIFGIIEHYSPKTSIPDNWQMQLEQLLGAQEQALHPFSAYRHNNKPSWQFARAGTPITITKNREVYTVTYDEPTTISTSELCNQIESLLSRPSLQNFRIAEIENSWKSIPPTDTLHLIPMTLTVSSGTFIRSLARRLGALLGVPMCAYQIHRTAVSVSDSETYT